MPMVEGKAICYLVSFKCWGKAQPESQLWWSVLTSTFSSTGTGAEGQ